MVLRLLILSLLQILSETNPQNYGGGWNGKRGGRYVLNLQHPNTQASYRRNCGK